MPILTRRRVAGLYLTMRLAGLAALPALALALSAIDELAISRDVLNPHQATPLMSHAGEIVRESVWSSLRRLSDGVWPTFGD